MKIKKCQNQKEIQKALKLRFQVFVCEQKVNWRLEIDELDVIRDDVIHLMITQNNEVIATLRMIKKNNYYQIGRVAVSKNWRRQKIGHILMTKCEEIAKNDKVKYLKLSSQVKATKFYTKINYKVISKPYIAGGVKIPHVNMLKILK